MVTPAFSRRMALAVNACKVYLMSANSKTPNTVRLGLGSSTTMYDFASRADAETAFRLLTDLKARQARIKH